MNKRLLNKLKADPTRVIHRQMLFKAITIDSVNHIISGVFSTSAVDRQGEVIEQAGWRLDEFQKNPVILFQHDANCVIGKGLTIGVNAAGELAGSIQFAYDESEKAAEVFRLYEGEYMRAFSVGFMNNVYEIDQENDVVILKDNTLLEISCVSVPANPEALALAKAKGLDITLMTAAEGVPEGAEEEGDEEENDVDAEGEGEIPVEEHDKPIEEKAKIVHAGDPCTMPDGTAGEMHPDKDGVMVCMMPPAKKATEEEKKAIAVIANSNIETIKTAIAALNGIVTASESKGPTPAWSGGKRIPVKILNGAIRQLLKVSSNEKKHNP